MLFLGRLFSNRGLQRLVGVAVVRGGAMGASGQLALALITFLRFPLVRTGPWWRQPTMLIVCGPSAGYCKYYIWFPACRCLSVVFTW